MTCEECKKRPATVHYTKIINDEKTEIHLCEKCAKEKGAELEFNIDPGFPINNFLSGLMNVDKSLDSGQMEKGVSSRETLQCEKCNLTYHQFSQISKLGCSSCYNIFSSELDPLLKRIHGKTSHTGKVPKRAGGNLRIKKQVKEKKEELQECIRKEEYEKAAKLRDEIKKLEDELE